MAKSRKPSESGDDIDGHQCNERQPASQHISQPGSQLGSHYSDSHHSIVQQQQKARRKSSPKSLSADLPAAISQQTEGEKIDAPQGGSHDWSYETTVTEIENIIHQIESGEMDLADVFEQFATAVSYLRQCEKFLAQRRQQMDLLIETLSETLDD